MRRTRVVPEPLFYPFPSLFVLAPFALLPLRAAMALFVGCSTALLSWGILAKSPERLPDAARRRLHRRQRAGTVDAARHRDAADPGVGFLAVVKPNVGLASVADDPSAIRILGGGALLLVSLAFHPNWPAEWLHNLRSMPGHPIPILVPGGALALLALLRWRRPEARLLVAMACVPQLMYFADQLPLWLVAKTRRESILLSATSLVAWVISLQAFNRRGPAGVRLELARAPRRLCAGADHGAADAATRLRPGVHRTTSRTLADMASRWTGRPVDRGPVDHGGSRLSQREP